MYWDQGSGDGVFDPLQTTLGYLTFTLDSSKSAAFTGGLWYTFRVAAVNVIGEGPYSESIAILAARVPNAPAVPTLV